MSPSILKSILMAGLLDCMIRKEIPSSCGSQKKMADECAAAQQVFSLPEGVSSNQSKIRIRIRIRIKIMMRL